MKAARKSKTRPPAPKPRKAPQTAVIVEDAAWRTDAEALRLMRRAAELALRVGAPASGAVKHDRAAVTLLLADDARLKDLNTRFRGRRKPTNVLSFPSADDAYWGDIAIAHGVVTREARAQGKSFAAHAAHLAAHGVLHLMGYDHETRREAAAMERLEIEILAHLGLPDPYAKTVKAA